MCRITGIWDFRQNPSYNPTETLANMRDSMAYGGPDAEGIFEDPQESLLLGHRRLSILDLSEAGNQPFSFEHFSIVFNGEVYNFQELREQLLAKGFSFTTGTDTEVILKAFIAWGPECVKSFRGMFAIAIWDSQEKELWLFRDRVGVKPLYWYLKEGLFMFGSELKAFHQHPHFDSQVDQDAVSLYLQQGYIPSSHCIFTYAHKVKPGSYMRVSQFGDISHHLYWQAEYSYLSPPLGLGEAELLTELESRLKDSFALRMVSDVPVGIFLSGGIDSSLVTALLQSQHSQPLKTFTIGFEQESFNEAPHASAVSAYLGTDHTEFICTEQDFAQYVESLPDFFDEPLSDDAAIPTHIVAKVARDTVKVSLSADGGDELFGGYAKYEFVHEFFPKLKAVPRPLAHAFHGILKPVDPNWLEHTGKHIPFLNRYTNLSNKFPKFRNALKSNSLTDLFHTISLLIHPDELKQLHSPVCNRYPYTVPEKEGQLLSLMGLIDIHTYLEGDILPKVDRATMQVALEGRDPFLDHEVIEFALRLPDKYKIHKGESKYLLKKLLYRYIPREIMDRPKQGFSVPIYTWLKQQHADELMGLASDTTFAEFFGLQQALLTKWIKGFLSGKSIVQTQFVWSLFVLFQWYKRWIR